MVKNKLETIFSKALHNDKDLWGMKLQNNMLAHTVTPADFIIDYVCEGVPASPRTQLHLHLVECKQTEYNDRLAFKRLRQMHDLLSFEDRRPHHHSWFCVCWWNGRINESKFYLVPARKLDEFTKTIGKLSCNIRDFMKVFFPYEMAVESGYINLRGLK